MKRWQIALVFLLLVLVLGIASQRYACVVPTSQAGALAALAHIQEWAKWMTGIQTAALAVLVYIVFEKDTVHIRELPSSVLFFVLMAFVFLGAALLCSSWIFSSLSSHAIRIYSSPLINNATISPDFDVYESPAFGWTTGLKLGHLLSAAHWLWVVGLVSLSLALGKLLFFGRAPNTK